MKWAAVMRWSDGACSIIDTTCDTATEARIRAVAAVPYWPYTIGSVGTVGSGQLVLDHLEVVHGTFHETPNSLQWSATGPPLIGTHHPDTGWHWTRQGIEWVIDDELLDSLQRRANQTADRRLRRHRGRRL